MGRVVLSNNSFRARLGLPSHHDSRTLSTKTRCHQVSPVTAPAPTPPAAPTATLHADRPASASPSGCGHSAHPAPPRLHRGGGEAAKLWCRLLCIETWKSSVRSDARSPVRSFLFLVVRPGAPFVASLHRKMARVTWLQVVPSSKEAKDGQGGDEKFSTQRRMPPLPTTRVAWNTNNTNCY